jgi:hypothetical protein
LTTQLYFDVPKLKVERASKHIDELEAWLTERNKVNAHANLVNKNAGNVSTSSIVFWADPKDSANISVIVGDTVHCLRTALDVAVSEIVSAVGDDPEKPPISFPMGNTRNDHISTKHYGRVQRAFPKIAAALADIVKPYKTGNSLFWSLNQLDRKDKHRILISTRLQLHTNIVFISKEKQSELPTVGPGTVFNIIDPETGNIIGEPTPGTAAYLHNQDNGYSALDIRFGKGEIFEDQPIIPTLRQLTELVGETINILKAHAS